MLEDRTFTQTILAADLEAARRRCGELERALSESRQETAALWKSDETLRRILRDFPYMILASDGAGVIVHWNKECERVTGYSKEEMLGIPNGIHLLFPDLKYAEKVVALAAEKAGAFRDLEIIVRTKSNQERVLSCTDISNSLPVPGWRRWLMARDITESKRAEKALRESELLFRNSFEFSSVGLLLCDLEGRVRHANPALCSTVGYPASEIIGRHVLELLHPDDHESATADMKALLSGAAASVRQERRMIARDGHGVWILQNCTVLRDENQSPQLHISQIIDISEQKRTLRSLEELNHRLNALFQGAHDAIFIVDPADGTILDVNRCAELLVGRDKASLVGAHFTSLHPPDLHEQCIAMFCEVLEQQNPTLREICVLTADGQRIPVEINASIVDLGDGRRVAHGIYRDISLRKRTEEALRISEERFRALSETSTVATFIHYGDRFVYANQATFDLTGYCREDLESMAFWDCVHPDFREAVRDRAAGRIRGERLSPRYELKLFTKDRCERWIELVATTIQFDDRRGILGTFFDITDRKRAEEALRESEERYRVLFNGATDAVIVHEVREDGLPGRIVGANDVACQRLGYSRDELCSMSIPDIDAPESEVDLRPVALGLRMNRDVLFEQVHVAKDGHRIPVEVHAKTVMVHGKRAVLSVVRDITERRKVEEEKAVLEEQLRQAQKMESIGRLAGGVAHDFNNILTSIGGNVELALMDLEPESPLHAMLTEITADVKSAAQLTRQLLAFSRKQIIEPRVIDLNGLIERARKMFVRLIGEDVELTTYPMAGPALVKADPGQLEQVLINLAVNARDAMPDGGKLLIETKNVTLDEEYCKTHLESKPGDYILLGVSDTGCGMTPKTMQHLFEPFYTTKPRGKGTGLGLAMVYGAVRQNGGSIQVYSEVGEGTTFKIYLPVVAAEAADANDGPVTVGALARGTETILLVEDEATVRDLAERFLERLGYSVLSFGDGESAVDGAAGFDNTIHLLMTDVVMPGMNGRALADRLSASRPGLRVLFTSGYTEDAIVHHGVLEEGIHFLGKPYSIFALSKKLRDILDSQ